MDFTQAEQNALKYLHETKEVTNYNRDTLQDIVNEYEYDEQKQWNDESYKYEGIVIVKVCNEYWAIRFTCGEEGFELDGDVFEVQAMRKTITKWVEKRISSDIGSNQDAKRLCTNRDR